MKREETIAYMSNSGVTFYTNRFPEPALEIFTIPRDVTEAQLRIMAAAPDLYEALAKLLSADTGDLYMAAWDRAEAALASACGKEETP